MAQGPGVNLAIRHCSLSGVVRLYSTCQANDVLDNDYIVESGNKDGQD